MFQQASQFDRHSQELPHSTYDLKNDKGLLSLSGDFNPSQFQHHQSYPAFTNYTFENNGSLGLEGMGEHQSQYRD